jgi:glycosyltransferase involved in cell wall biosynthesis
MQRKKKSCLVIYGPNPYVSHRTGGVAKWMLYLQSITKNNKIYPYFLFADSLRLEFLPRIIQQFVNFFIYSFRLLFIPLQNHAILHVNTSLFSNAIYRDFFVILLAKSRGMTLFIQIHGGRLSNIKIKTLSHKLWRHVFRISDYLGVFPGPQWKEFAATKYYNKMIRMYNAIPSTEGCAWNNEKVHFLFLGRLSHEKGSYLLLDNFIRLRKEGFKGIELTIAGDGALLNKLRKTASLSEYSNDIHIKGFVKGLDLKKILDNTNVFVLPSKHQEGFPLSFLECAERGMTCLVTKNSAIPELFEENLEFVSVDLDVSNDLYLKLKYIIKHENERIGLGKAVQKKVKNNFTIEATEKRMNEIYLKILESSKESKVLK